MENCPITQLPTKEFKDHGSVCQYKIEYANDLYFITLGREFTNIMYSEPYIEKNIHLIAGAILNNQLIEGEGGGYKVFQIGSDWKEKIAKIDYPTNPKEKMDNLLKSLYQRQHYDGEEVDIEEIVEKPAFWYKHFFKNENECYFYFEILKAQNFIDISWSQRHKINRPVKPGHYNLNLNGLNYYLEITESGRLSNKCFVAMSFSNETKEIREAIREALIATSFIPILVDELHIDSDKTINDRIIAELKGAKFCIADFTELKGGVYFESGFALGQGKPVIYCCAKKDFKDSHFDINHFSHILYDEPAELREALINKINAWIK